MDLNWYYYLLPIAVTLLVTIYLRISSYYGYFRNKPIPSLDPVPLFGSMLPLFLKKYTLLEFHHMLYNRFPNAKVIGMFDMTTRFFMLRDPELIKKVLVKDFEYFIDRRSLMADDVPESDELLMTKSLILLKGQKWREMRATLSPAFTGSKMRAMFELMVSYSDRMVRILKAQTAEEHGAYMDCEMKDCCMRIASDIIATCAYGLDVESLENRQNDFFTMGKKMMNFGGTLFFVRILLYSAFPKLMSKLKVELFDSEQTRYFAEIIKETVKTREKHGITRPDMIHLLMQARKGTLRHHQDTAEQTAGFATVEESEVGKFNSGKMITDSELVAQCLIFFIAGFEVISSQLAFMCYELASNQDIQQKLYEEILQTKNDLQGKPLTYDALQQMQYMDMVTSEVLRMWSGPVTDRKCVRDYVLEDADGLRVTIEAGTYVMIPIYGIHRDPKYYPDPNKFDPERFSGERRSSIDMTMYLPFGAGPRNCIGSRFALMEMKAIVYALLLNFHFELNEKSQVPLQLKKGFASLAGERGIHLRLRARK